MIRCTKGLLPVPASGEVLRHTFVGVEPVGDYAWLGGLTRAGTAEVIGTVDEVVFSVGVGDSNQ